MGRNCLDCGDWVVVVFLFSFAAAGATYCFLARSDLAFGAWTGTLGILCGAFHWIRVKDQKIADAP